MRLMLASARGLLSGWLMALTLPLLAEPHTISAWSAAGLGSRWRVLLAAVELLGAGLFALETPLLAGWALLLLSFAAAAVVHLQHGEMPWWLAAYAFIATALWRCTLRVRRLAGRALDAAAPG
jgi:hypothetical protein